MAEYFYMPLEATITHTIQLSTMQSSNLKSLHIFFNSNTNLPFKTAGKSIKEIANIFRTHSNEGINLTFGLKDITTFVEDKEAAAAEKAIEVLTFQRGMSALPADSTILEAALVIGAQVAQNAGFTATVNAVINQVPNIIVPPIITAGEVGLAVEEAETVFHQITDGKVVLIAECPAYSRDHAFWTGLSLLNRISNIQAMPFTAFPYS
ncbi:MAG: hypothetical protein H6850_01995 [Alphaproteobacteria bacterium]|nr:MAG: hypothetical protein H6850_01995 [Alphaproteobacteria bacterium]